MRCSYSHRLEIVAVLLLGGVLLAQLLSYPITEDPDPDGYVSYARHLRETWSLPVGHIRLPGYPAFLAAADALGPGTLHEDATRAQIGLYAAWVGVLWWLVRRRLGPATALVLLAILAAPNLLTRLAATLLSDALASVLVALCAWALWRMVERGPVLPRLGWVPLLIRLDYLRLRPARYHPGSVSLPARHLAVPPRSITSVASWLLLFAVLAPLAFAVHPTSRVVLVLLIVALAVALVLHRARVPVARLVAALVVLWGATVAVEAWAGEGSQRYNTSALMHPGLLCLPPIADTEADRRIEAGKAALAARLGYPARDATPQVYPEISREIRSIPNAILHPLWLDRLRADPLSQVACALRQARWRWHIAAKQYAPFWSERRLVTVAYLPATGSPREALFRATGVELLAAPDAASWGELARPLAVELGRILAFLVPLLVGAVALVRRFGAPATAVIAAGVLWCGALGLTHVLDARYLSAFAVPIALAQAVGIVAAVRWAWTAAARAAVPWRSRDGRGSWRPRARGCPGADPARPAARRGTIAGGPLA